MTKSYLSGVNGSYVPLPAFGCPTHFEPGERDAMQADLSGLLDILSYARPHDSDGEALFLAEYLYPALDALGVPYDFDGFGNIWANIPAKDDRAAVLWSCHVDTVARKGGRQGIAWGSDGRTIRLSKRKPGRCLGADDGAGIWLLLEMMRQGVPGGYVFHRGEEVGRLGSEYVSRSEPERLKPYGACVAFDRRDFSDLITHQMGQRTASDAFAGSLSTALNVTGYGLRYRPDDGGSYTDSYSYAGQVPECCNVSVGYDREHGPNETLDGLHVFRLRNALLKANLASLVVERDPATFDDFDYYGGYGGGSYGSSSWSSRWGGPGSLSRTGAAAWATGDNKGNESATSRTARLVALIERYPAAAAELLQQYGLGMDELLDVMTDSEIAGAVGGGWAND